VHGGGSLGGEGVFGQSSSDSSGVYGKNTASGAGVVGEGGPGVHGRYGLVSPPSPVSFERVGVAGESAQGIGVFGYDTESVGVYGLCGSINFPPGSLETPLLKMGVVGTGPVAVFGYSDGSPGVDDLSVGVWGYCAGITGVGGLFWGADGVAGYSIGQGNGVKGSSANVGVFAENTDAPNLAWLGSRCCAGDFHGRVHVAGMLQKSGGGFEIDYPHSTYAANKYLRHSFVESPDMKNVYDGIVIVDTRGEAVVELPEYFELLNRDFRYQLTPIGAAGPNLHILQEISNHRFRIGGGVPGMRVCWQVSGIRQDPWANANRIQVEEEKPSEERGYYLHPEVHGQPPERSVHHSRYPRPKGPNSRGPMRHGTP
jgi:hypothetical protein